jgi:nitrate reductase NapE component
MAFCTNCGAAVSGAFCQQCGQPAGVAAAPAPAPVPQPTPAAPAPVARRTSPIVWVLVIVLGLFVLAGVAVVGAGWFVARTVQKAGLDPELMRRNPALAVSKLIANLNPDLEVLHVNEGKGVITVKEKSTGRVVTLNFDDIKQGRIVVHEEGEGKTASVEFGASAGKVPSWVPVFPGAKVEGTFAVNTAEGQGGSFAYKTSESAAKVMEFYQGALTGAGFKITTTAATGESHMISAEDEANQRTLVVTASSGSVNVVFNVKK